MDKEFRCEECGAELEADDIVCDVCAANEAEYYDYEEGDE